MAHRGRLNVLAHVLHRTYASILAEFEGRPASEVAEELPEGGFGDVKYHHGAHSTREMSVPIIGDDGIERLEKRTIALSLMPNPSHLEFVNPVVAGKVRALQTRPLALAGAARPQCRAVDHDPRRRGVPRSGDRRGDAEPAVARRLLRGRNAAPDREQPGRLHDRPEDERSTQHSSDLAKGFDIPIIHVNADDIEACRTATRLAITLRERFERDVLIDLVGYRRYGHNEGDEPSYTQRLYERIAEGAPVAELYAGRLIVEGVVTEDDVAEIRSRVPGACRRGARGGPRGHRGAHTRGLEEEAPRPAGSPATDAAELTELNETLLAVPEGFTVHPKLASQLERRRAALVDGGIDWGHAEALAFGSLLRDGVPIGSPAGLRARHGRPPPCRTARRAHGRDVRAHAARAGREGSFEVHNWPALRERMPLDRVRLLDHQVRRPGDLGGAVRRLRERRTGGHRPVHRVRPLGSGARPPGSRCSCRTATRATGPSTARHGSSASCGFAADDNLRIANVTTPAQHYHLVRDQSLRPKRRPLVVMTPKGLLRFRDAASTLDDLLDPTGFRPVMDESTTRGSREDMSRLVLCTGRSTTTSSAIPSVPGRTRWRSRASSSSTRSRRSRSPSCFAATQSSPRSCGPGGAAEHGCLAIAATSARGGDAEGVEVGVESRPWRASPSEGYQRDHAREQDRIVRSALGLPPVA